MSRVCSLSIALGLALLVPACGNQTPARSHRVGLSGTSASEQGNAAKRVDIRSAPRLGLARGAPHTAPIADLVLAIDSPAAVSIDVRGGVRLWPTVTDANANADAEGAEPLVVPAFGATRVSLAGRDEHRTLAYVDTAGAGHVLRLDPHGQWREIFATGPEAGLRQLEVLPGGQHLLALAADGNLRLHRVDGGVLAVLDERGFTPGELSLARDGKTALTLRVSPRAVTVGAQIVDLAAQRLAITLAPKPALSLLGDEIEIDAVVGPIAVAPTADALAFLATLKSGKRQPMLAELTTTAAPRPLAPSFEIDAGKTAIGFVGPRQLWVAPASGPSWVVSAKGTRALPRPSLRFGAPGTLALATAPDLAILAKGSWLFVQRPSTATHAYLGYAPFSPNTGAISPSGRRLAWAAVDIFVEPLKQGATTRLANNGRQISKLAFLDEEHLLVMDALGGVRVIDTRDGRILQSADASGAARKYDLDTLRRLIAIHTDTGIPQLFTYDADFTLHGPFTAPQRATASGLVAKRVGAPDAMWTHDGEFYRSFTIQELRAGISQAAVQSRGVLRKLPNASAGDRWGRVYGLRYGREGALILSLGPDGRKMALSLTQGVSAHRIVPAPAGKRFALHSSDHLLHVYDAQGLELWQRPVEQALGDIFWSVDGRYLITAGQAGGGIWNSADGSPARLRCGVWFERRQTAPSLIQLNFLDAPLCEL